MNWLVITGVRPWDGRYEFDLDARPLTAREWGWIKRHSGYYPLDVGKGLDGGDPELFSIWAVIALRRAGRIQDMEVVDTYERLLDVPYGATITFQGDEKAEADAGPPPGSSDGSRSFSGPGSPTSSETSQPTPPPSGIPDSDTSVSRLTVLGS